MIVFRMNKVGELVEAFLKQKSKTEMLDFLRGILTPSEFDEIVTRLQIVKLLKKGLPHQEIARRLKVGVATVTRGSREIRMGRFKKI
ncbi:MAG: Trp repressor [Candidatus Roizmanbacteria bacterium GW2011_GWA2_35_19]|uniref:Trp repressor n=2 Tax=Candidatus Roizmaniibacteriota TaxID=1752723 RepID=A0A0G0BYT3_9BACT|nr:MAG: Trp repressor [Candidatus Roizmanbacteria bacterium GW2011_GWC2_35_12]KKP74489.1 MAG: Trp repressor [Candidatus Roizmanbacteria bacterium GW2011_GWA2_35_19]